MITPNGTAGARLTALDCVRTIGDRERSRFAPGAAGGGVVARVLVLALALVLAFDARVACV